MKCRTAILASGEGTTAEAFIRDEVMTNGMAEVVLVICSKADAGILSRVAKLNSELNLTIQTLVINGKTHPASSDEVVLPGHQTTAEQTAIIATLRAANVQLVVLLGYMKLVGPAVVDAYEGWMLNTHPGLLPVTQGSYGIHTAELVLEQKLSEAGQTLHIVSESYDGGQVIAENKVRVEPNDTPESLFARIQATEKAHLAGDIDSFIKSRQQYILGT